MPEPKRSRDDGFTRADVDTGKHSDPKVKRLWRLLRDEARMNAALVLHEATLLESWADGRRVRADEAAPPWMTDVETPTADLVRAGLLDEEQRIPTHAWDVWFGKAWAEREKLRARWTRMKRGQRGTESTSVDDAQSTEDTPEDSTRTTGGQQEDSRRTAGGKRHARSTGRSTGRSTEDSPVDSREDTPGVHRGVHVESTAPGPSGPDLPVLPDREGRTDSQESDSARAKPGAGDAHRKTNGQDRDADIARHRAKVADPSTSTAVREAAIAELQRLGASLEPDEPLDFGAET